MIRSVHVWGFFDPDGSPRLPDGVAPSEMCVIQMHERVVGNITRNGGTVGDVVTTRTLDGFLVATEFQSPPRGDGDAAAMWHQIVRPSQVWPA